MSILELLKEKVLNPHCPNFRTCERRQNKECLFCINCIKGTEEYLNRFNIGILLIGE